EIEGKVGLRIGTLPVRARVAGDQSVGEFLLRLQEELVDSQRFEHSPLAQVQSLSGVASGQPLFQSLVVFENYPVDPSAQESRDFSIADVETVEQTNYPLVILGIPESRFLIRFSYDSDLFEAATA